MFKFADIGRMWVAVDLPLGEGDAPPRIHLLQTLYTREELRQRDQQLLARASGDLPEGGTPRSLADVQAMTDRALAIEDADLAELLERTHDWRDVQGDDGAPAVFSRERLQSLLAYQWFARAARQALFTASREGVRKN